MRQVASRQDDPKDKPLSEAVLLILASLAGAPRHGYALIKDIESLSSGRVRLTTGTLYGALARLLDEGWIEKFDQEDTSRDKQAYRLTPVGRRRLRAALDRMRELVRITSSGLKGVEVPQ
jgi:DNA-binding PadR family transcriptional regulator